MEKVFNNAGFFLLSLGFSALISFGFFSAGVTRMQNEVKCLEKEHLELQNQIDSLESVVNTSFKNNRDTIVIQIKPQTVKYYHYEK